MSIVSDFYSARWTRDIRRSGEARLLAIWWFLKTAATRPRLYAFASGLSALLLIIAFAMSVETDHIVTAIARTLPSDRGPVAAIAYRVGLRVKSEGVSVNGGRARWDSNKSKERHCLFLVVPSRNLCWLGIPFDFRYYEHKMTERQFFVLNDRLVGVSTNNSALNFYISVQPVPSGNLEQFAATAFRARLKNPEFDRTFTFRMGEALGTVSPFGEGNSFGEPAPEITRIAVRNDGFTLTLRGGEHDNIVDAMITFGTDFRPVSATLKGKQVFPNSPTPSPVSR